MCTYIYENGKKREKEKKRISRLNGPEGIFGSAKRARSAQRGPPIGYSAVTMLWVWAHTPVRGEGNGVRGETTVRPRWGGTGRR
jgi:hypothetical protein